MPTHDNLTIAQLLERWAEPRCALIYDIPDRPGLPGRRGQWFLADGVDLWIGRDVGRTDLHLRWEHPDHGASAKHAQVIRGRNGWKLVDRSRNGTVLTPAAGEPRRIHDDVADLAHGDRITIGRTDLWFAGASTFEHRRGITPDQHRGRHDDLEILGSLSDDDVRVVQSAWEAHRKLGQIPSAEQIGDAYERRVGVHVQRMDKRLSTIYKKFRLSELPRDERREQLIRMWGAMRARQGDIIETRLRPQFGSER